jgi:hypothetical protein
MPATPAHQGGRLDAIQCATMERPKLERAADISPVPFGVNDQARASRGRTNPHYRHCARGRESDDDRGSSGGGPPGRLSSDLTCRLPAGCPQPRRNPPSKAATASAEGVLSLRYECSSISASASTSGASTPTTPIPPSVSNGSVSASRALAYAHEVNLRAADSQGSFGSSSGRARP